jgi:WD40 repeat protein
MAEWPPLRDYSKSRAVVMGTWDFEYLPRIPAAANSLNRMADLLTGPLCGWPRDRLLVLANESRPGDLPDRLITAFEDITEVALFYYVGHGQMDSEGRLCLCLTESRTEANRRATTSLTFQSVRQAMLDSAAATKIVLVDCCFAGLASQSATNALAAHADDIADVTSVSGTYTMAASGDYAKAAYEIEPDIVRPQTYFTKYLADLVEAGIPGETPGLRLHQLFLRLRDNLVRDQRPVPYERSVDAARDFVFAHNAAPPETIRDPDAQLRQLTERLAAADARGEVLRALVEERTRELERLHEQAGHIQSMAADQQRQLRDAIDVAERQLDETVDKLDESAATHATVEAERSEFAAAAAATQTPPVPLPPVIKRRSNRRPRPLRFLAAIGCCALLTVLFSADSPGLPPLRPVPSPPTSARHVKLAATLTIAGGEGISDVAFSPNGKLFAASGNNGDSAMWDVADTRNPVRTFTDPGDDHVANAVTFSPESNAVAIADDDGKVYLWNLPGSAGPASTITGPGMTDGVAGIAFSPDGDTLAVACNYGCTAGFEVTYLWNLASRRFAATYIDPGTFSSCGLESVAFSPNGQDLAAGDCDGSTYLWNVRNDHAPLRTFENPGEGGTFETVTGAVAFSPNGKILAVCDDGKSTYLWNVDSGTRYAVLTDPDGSVYAAFSPSGKVLAVSGGANSTYLFDVATGKVIATLPEPGTNSSSGGGVEAVAFSPDGALLAVAGGNGDVYLWDTPALAS